MSGRDHTLLIIDDDQVALDTFTLMLKAVGYGALKASDPIDGLRQVDQYSPDGLLVDLHLPTFDGIEFVRRLRTSSQHRHMPVAIITGDYFLDESVADQLGALGARLYFKPIWEDDLIRIARDLLARQMST